MDMVAQNLMQYQKREKIDMGQFIETIKDRWFRKVPDPEFVAIIDNLVNLVNKGHYELSRFRDGDFSLYSYGDKVEIKKFQYPREHFYVRMVVSKKNWLDDRHTGIFYATAGNRDVLKQLDDIVDQKENKKKADAPKLIMESLATITRKVEKKEIK